MVRMDTLNEVARNYLLSQECPSFDDNPFISGPSLNQRRVAIITTAGLHTRSDRPFHLDQSDTYRVIPGNVSAKDLVMSHMATSFDRSGFQQDCNIVFPIDRLRELVEQGVIGSLADYHYSFGTPLSTYNAEVEAREIACILKKDNVNAVLLFPV